MNRLRRFPSSRITRKTDISQDVIGVNYKIASKTAGSVVETKQTTWTFAQKRGYTARRKVTQIKIMLKVSHKIKWQS